MRVMANSRRNSSVFIDVKQSFNNPDRMFISTPNMVELDPEQVVDLIDALQAVARRIWPHTNKETRTTCPDSRHPVHGVAS